MRAHKERCPTYLQVPGILGQVCGHRRGEQARRRAQKGGGGCTYSGTGMTKELNSPRKAQGCRQGAHHHLLLGASQATAVVPSPSGAQPSSHTSQGTYP